MVGPAGRTPSTIRADGRETALDALRARAARLAAALDGAGANGGAGVALLMRNDLPFFETVMAARLSGAYLVPVNWHFAPAEVGYILRDSGARVLIAHDDLARAVADEVPSGVRVICAPTPQPLAAAYAVPDSACSPPPGALVYDEWIAAHRPIASPATPRGSTMLYSSGTTGHPKGVRRMPLADQALGELYAAVGATFGIRPGMRTVMTGPLYHSAPFGYAMAGLHLGCDLLLMPRFDARALLALIESERLTHMHLVPTMFVRLLRLPGEVRGGYDLSSLECVTHGAAPCPPEIKRQMIEWWGPVIREYYGSTEGSLITAIDSEEWLSHPGSVGRARPGCTFSILDDDGNALPPGEIGEIYSRVDAAPDFDYHGRPEDRRAVERDGLITNGDLGYADEEGFLYLCDRKRDMVISGGVNIYPAEIEAALLTHPRVHDCAVFGIPHDEFGESVAAAIELTDGPAIAPSEITDHLERRIARFKIPRTLTFHDELPRLDNGKIYKARLRERYTREGDR